MRKSPPSGGLESEILLGENFLPSEGNLRRSDFDDSNRFKAKNSFPWTLNINYIKINMACVSKEYEIKTKMEQEQWLQLKKLFLFGYNLKIVLWWGELIINHKGVYCE